MQLQKAANTSLECSSPVPIKATYYFSTLLKSTGEIRTQVLPVDTERGIELCFPNSVPPLFFLVQSH